MAVEKVFQIPELLDKILKEVYFTYLPKRAIRSNITLGSYRKLTPRASAREKNGEVSFFFKGGSEVCLDLAFQTQYLKLVCRQWKDAIDDFPTRHMSWYCTDIAKAYIRLMKS